MRTQIAIIGAGPAGMFLAFLLREYGIDAVVLERRDRAYVEGRVRAGVLERTTMEVLNRLGLGERAQSKGIAQAGTNIAVEGDIFRIDMSALTGKAGVTVYGQQEIMYDLFNAAPERGIDIMFNVDQVALHDLKGASYVTWKQDGVERRLNCDYIAGCDGFHGVCRSSIPIDARKLFEREYPFGWLGILAEVPPCHHELIYANHSRGFALASMRSHTRSRYYIQCGLDESVEDWPDKRFWDEVSLRIGSATKITRGSSFEKSITQLRSVVTEPMRHGNLFLAGDAAHIVPPTGAKGMNLAIIDVVMLAKALNEFYNGQGTVGIDQYSHRALARVWKAERFCWWFTNLTHRFPDMDEFTRKLQLAELDYLRSSRSFQISFAENYTGMQLEEDLFETIDVRKKIAKAI